MDFIGRRNFLKTTATTLALSAMPLYSSAKTKGSDTLKVAIIGSGRSGWKAIKALFKINQNTKIVAIADAFDDCAKALHKKALELSEKYQNKTDIFDVPQSRIFVGLDAYKEAIDCADIAVLATPPVFRPQEVEYAIMHNKHVLMEKPICVDSVQARKMYQLASIATQKNLTAISGVQRRYHKGYQEAIKRVQDGQIGEILYAQCYWFLSHFDGMDLKTPPNFDPEELEYQLRNWGLFTWTCGDHIVEQQVHNLDIMRWAFGRNPNFVSAIGGRRLNLPMPQYGNRFSHFSAEFDFGNDVRLFAQCRQEPNTAPQVVERIIGTEGVMETSLFSKQLIRGKNNWQSPQVEDPIFEEYRTLVKSAREGLAINTIAEMTDACMYAISARMSAYSGLKFKFDWALRKPKKSLLPENLKFGKLPIEPLPISGEYKII
ncbi:MAG: Gfo/Idh/MocA family oxidoreductase [Verrucomicrobiaceae bacterium]|nr:Gfo/Idh/MocA family oxidoreductase [Verrucomicrobiaceae bacterium]